MSYRARCEGRAWRRRNRKQPPVSDLTPFLKWHYPLDAHPWWIVLSVKRRWIRSLSEAFRLKEEWLDRWPNERRGGLNALFYTDRPFFAVVRKDVSPGS